MRNLTKNQFLYIVGFLFCFLIGIHAFVFWPVSTSQKQRAAVLLESIDYYLVSNGFDTLYFSSVDTIQGFSKLSFSLEDCVQRSLDVGFFISRAGKIKLQKNAFYSPYDSAYFCSNDDLILEKSNNYLLGKCQVLNKQIKELEYYVQTHMHADDGFEEMKSLYAECLAKLDYLDSLSNTIEKFVQASSFLKWQRVQKVFAYYSPEGRRRKYTCGPVVYKKNKAETQLIENGLPVNAKSIINPLFRVSDLSCETDSFTKGSVSSELFGYVGKLKSESFEYSGEIQFNMPNGMGICIYNDGSISQGLWKNGLLHGSGWFKDKDDAVYSGDWEEGYLMGGNVVYPDGSSYNGAFWDNKIFDGAGERFYADGSIYYGSWADGQRQDFGMYVDADGTVQCGSWKDDKFEGERLLYTADRVYGIDIARYQHINRYRKACNISWKYLRIKSLGTRSEKRISGIVSYPISFVYIKATEGATVLNSYFKSDYQQARNHGIHVGAYHFFSSAPVEEQLAWFFKNTIYKKGDLPPVLDLEPTDSYIKDRWGNDEIMFEQVLKWLKTVEAKFGVKPLLYVNQMFIRNHLSKASEEIQSYDLWVARYGEFKPYSHMIYWQISPDGKVSGIQSDVDINVFNGSKERFEEYLKTFN